MFRAGFESFAIVGYFTVECVACFVDTEFNFASSLRDDAVDNGVFHDGLEQHSGNFFQVGIDRRFHGDPGFERGTQLLQLEIQADPGEFVRERDKLFFRGVEHVAQQLGKIGEVAVCGVVVAPDDQGLNGAEGVEQEMRVHL